ncbi:TonB-dependent receptor [Altererythrobacter sp. FM1]|uniref:TonB-dependent receptor n=1 Tax=Tsuneonella flava TaxID=2055955 RepID=UPI000C8040FE|nr:TonB-dependent receptor [Tsuneonella flava]ROT93423.1 TonB-dependent receptor [Altererythrobacter sp. FM1]
MNFKHLMVTVSAVALCPSLAYAQDATEENDATAKVDFQADAIVVTGTRGSLKTALGIKRDATGVVDAIVAEDIVQFPDQNVAEALQRIPGITIERDQGQGSEIIVRGFTSQYTRTEVNGLTALTSKDNRGFDFKLLASELFSKAEVYKTASASRTEGGTASIVNLVTPKPLDKDGFTIASSANGTYAEVADEFLPRAALLISQNWNDRFGIAASLAYSENSINQDAYEVGGSWADLAFRSSGSPTGVTEEELEAWYAPVPMRTKQAEDLKRLGATLDIQFAPNETSLITASAIYGRLERDGYSLRQDIFGGKNSEYYDLTIEDGIAVAGSAYGGGNPRVYSKERPRTDTLQQYSLTGDFDFADRWNILAQIGYTKGEGKEDLYETGFGLDQGAIEWALEGDFIVGSVIPDHDGDGVYENNGEAIDPMDPASYPKLRFLSDKFYTQINDEFSVKFDVGREFDGFLQEVRIGGRYSDTVQDFTREQQDWNHTSVPNSIDVASSLAAPGVAGYLPWHVPGAPSSYPSTIFFVDYDALAGFVSETYGTEQADRVMREANSFRISEETYAGFLEAKFGTDRLSGNAGVRFVKTEVTSSGHRVVGGLANNTGWLVDEETIPVEFVRDYSEWLPSLNLKYRLRDDFYLRASAGRTITRPLLTDMSPEASFNINTLTGSAKNPGLDPLTAWNFDVSAEWYFSNEGLVSLAFFHKKMDSLVEVRREMVDVEVENPDGTTSVAEVSMAIPVNGDTATVTGLEFNIQTPFSFLPSPLDGFGGQFNFTYADSNAEFSFAEDQYSVTLPGLSKSSFNAILYYQKGKVDTRLAYNWRSEYLRQLNPWGGHPVYRDAYGQLDYSFNYHVNDNISLRFKAINLLQETKYEYTEERKDLPTNVRLDERSFTFGVSFKY